MNSRNLLVTSLTILAISIVIIISYRNISSAGIVIIGGILFTTVGILNLMLMRRRTLKQQNNKKTLTTLFGRLSSLAAIILGVCMLVFNATFATLVNFIFGLLITFASIYQFYIIVATRQPRRLPIWLYTAPILLVAASIILFVYESIGGNDSTIMLTTGIAFAIFAIAGIIEAIYILRATNLPLITDK